MPSFLREYFLGFNRSWPRELFRSQSGPDRRAVLLNALLKIITTLKDIFHITA